jgi:sRNA-binding protein
MNKNGYIQKHLEHAKLEMEQAKAAYEVALNKHNQAKETDSLANNLDYKAKKELEKATNTVIQPIPPQAEKPKQGLLGLGFWVL